MGDITLKPRPVSTGTFKTTPLTREYVNDVLDSNRLSYGKFSQEFEQQIAEKHGCKYGILVNSGTSALQIALQAMKEIHGWEYGKVITPATTFVATLNIVRHCGLTVTPVDVDPYTFNLDPQLLPAAIAEDTRCIIPVSLLGQSADFTAIKTELRVLGRGDIKVIEDDCEAMFAEHLGKPVGCWGDIACFSTYVAHIIVTGVGGIATTNNPGYAAKMRSLANHGLMIEYLNPDENFAPQPMVGRRFRFDSYGHSYRLTELEAAVGCAQLENEGQIFRIRERNARHLRAGIERLNRDYDSPFAEYRVEPYNRSANMMFPIVLERETSGKNVSKEPLMKFLNEHQIETRDLLPIIGQPIYRWMLPDHYPVSGWLAESGFYVGCHQDLEPSDIDYVIQTLEQYLYRGHNAT